MTENNGIIIRGQMVYGGILKREILAEGQYEGYDILVLSLGTHPCCYIRLDESNKFYGKNYDDIPLMCHGGLTFSENIESDNIFKKGYWIGWDYAHCDDKYGTVYDGIEYTVDELVSDIKEAVKNLKTI